MLKHVQILIILCGVALFLTGAGTLYYFLQGNFRFVGVGVFALLLFFALLIILLKERRILRIMQEDDYDRERDAV